MLNSASTIIETLNRICHVGQTVFGIENLKQMGARLSQELGYKYAFFGRPKSEGSTIIVTDVAFSNGEIVENFQYELAGTPCALVMSGKRVCIHAHSVAEQFPQDILLKKMNVEGYAGAPMIDPQGCLCGLVVILDDKEITDDLEYVRMILGFVATRAALEFSIQRHEDQRRLEIDQEFQRQKLESIGQITSGVAHDFNNLLSAILGHAEMMQSKLGPESALQKHLSPILQSVQRGRNITKQLTDYAKPMQSGSAVNDVHGIIDEVVALISSSLDGVLLSIDKKATACAVKIEGSQLQQILINLIVNARDAMNQHGEIRICTESIEGADHKGILRLSVSDTGSGIDPEHLSKIFDPFFTTKGAAGTGLGLASSFGIVQSCDGSICVESELGQGTSFIIDFPLSVSLTYHR